MNRKPCLRWAAMGLVAWSTLVALRCALASAEVVAPEGEGGDSAWALTKAPLAVLAEPHPRAPLAGRLIGGVWVKGRAASDAPGWLHVAHGPIDGYVPREAVHAPLLLVDDPPPPELAAVSGEEASPGLPWHHLECTVGTVRRSTALWVGPGGQGGGVGTLDRKAGVLACARKERWTLVRTEEGQHGWVDIDALWLQDERRRGDFSLRASTLPATIAYRGTAASPSRLWVPTGSVPRAVANVAVGDALLVHHVHGELSQVEVSGIRGWMLTRDVLVGELDLRLPDDALARGPASADQAVDYTAVDVNGVSGRPVPLYTTWRREQVRGYARPGARLAAQLVDEQGATVVLAGGHDRAFLPREDILLHQELAGLDFELPAAVFDTPARGPRPEELTASPFAVHLGGGVWAQPAAASAIAQLAVVVAPDPEVPLGFAVVTAVQWERERTAPRLGAQLAVHLLELGHRDLVLGLHLGPQVTAVEQTEVHLTGGPRLELTLWQTGAALGVWYEAGATFHPVTREAAAFTQGGGLYLSQPFGR